MQDWALPHRGKTLRTKKKKNTKKKKTKDKFQAQPADQQARILLQLSVSSGLACCTAESGPVGERCPTGMPLLVCFTPGLSSHLHRPPMRIGTQAQIQNPCRAGWHVEGCCNRFASHPPQVSTGHVMLGSSQALPEVSSHSTPVLPRTHLGASRRVAGSGHAPHRFRQCILPITNSRNGPPPNSSPVPT